MPPAKDPELEVLYAQLAQSATRLMHGIAGAVLVTLPVVVLVFALQRQFVAGLTAGAVKQ